MVWVVRTGVISFISHHATVLGAMQSPVPFLFKFKLLKKVGCIEQARSIYLLRRKYRIGFGTSEKTLFRYKYENNVQIDLKVVCEVVNWIELNRIG
jgi:hypothetical protein